jgi:transcription initiation factor TFIIH subunit 1
LGAGTAATSDATKAAKADKMAGYLRLTEGKVEAVVQTAQVAGVDVGRVKAVSTCESTISREERTG